MFKLIEDKYTHFPRVLFHHQIWQNAISLGFVNNYFKLF
jgi:hypothetical protein